MLAVQTKKCVLQRQPKGTGKTEERTWQFLKDTEFFTMLFRFPSFFLSPYILSFQHHKYYHLNVFSKRRKVISPEQTDFSYSISKSSLSPEKLQNQSKYWSKRKMQQMTYSGMGWIKWCCFRKKKAQSNSRFLLNIFKGRKTADSSLLSLSLKKKLSKNITHTLFNKVQL